MESELDYGYFPKNLVDLTSAPSEMSSDDWRGPYLRTAVTKDIWGTELKYSASDQEDKVSLISAGPDKEFNTADDVRN